MLVQPVTFNSWESASISRTDTVETEKIKVLLVLQLFQQNIVMTETQSIRMGAITIVQSQMECLALIILPLGFPPVGAILCMGGRKIRQLEHAKSSAQHVWMLH